MAAILLTVAASAQPQNARAVGVEHADGRITYSYLRQGGGFWGGATPLEPGTDTSRDGVRLVALDVRHLIDGEQVRARISLLYGTVTTGSPMQRVVEVDTVLLNPGQSVRVDALASYGVQPIRLWIADVPAVTRAAAPAIESTSDRLTVKIEAIAGAVPVLRASVTNNSSQVLRTFRIVMHRAGEAIGGPTRGGTGELPLVEPGATYTWEWRPPIRSNQQGMPEWVVPDRIVIEPTRWSDK